MYAEEKIYNGLFEHLGSTASSILKKIPLSIFKDMREIRFSVGNPMQIVFKDKINSISREGKFCGRYSRFDSLTKDEIQNIFLALCEFSMHTFNREISEGFITINGGYRAGICGTAVYENGEIINVKDISSINLRVPHEILGAADEIGKIIKYEGITKFLIAGPPCSGKTTLLRDLARQFGSGICGKDYRVSIIDERMEIAGICRGKASFDIGTTTDVFNGYLKSDGIIMAVRTMAPDIIICDEFGGDDEIKAALYAMKCGASIVASMHAYDREELITKKSIADVIKEGVFERIVFMNKSCEIDSILKADDLI